MRQKSESPATTSEQVVKNIRRATRKHHSAEEKIRVVLDALDTALAARRPDNVIHHSDRGSQYTSVAFGNRCRKAGVRPSTGSVGEAYDNAIRRHSALGYLSPIEYERRHDGLIRPS